MEIHKLSVLGIFKQLLTRGKKLSDFMIILNIFENWGIEQCWFLDAAVAGQSDKRKR